jgi:RimJ/RimL family protein N-acetyltransferase
MPLPIETERLRLRPWEPADLDAFHALYGDPVVMRLVGGGPSRDLDHSRRRLAWMIDHQRQHGYSLWAIAERASGRIVGDCGMVLIEGEGPDVEVAYKLHREAWGRGYATEAAAASVEFAFREAGPTRVLGFTYPENADSQHVLEKIGLRRIEDRQEHGHTLAAFVIERPAALLKG